MKTCSRQRYELFGRGCRAALHRQIPSYVEERQHRRRTHTTVTRRAKGSSPIRALSSSAMRLASGIPPYSLSRTRKTPFRDPLYIFSSLLVDLYFDDRLVPVETTLRTDSMGSFRVSAAWTRMCDDGPSLVMCPPFSLALLRRAFFGNSHLYSPRFTVSSARGEHPILGPAHW